jgi:hypothetical protein
MKKVAVRVRKGIQLVVYGAIHPPLPAGAYSSADATDQSWRGREGPGQGGELRTRSPNLLFLCGWYQSALASWHRVASDLVRPPHAHQSFPIICDRRARKCGGKCVGLSGSVPQVDRSCGPTHQAAVRGSVEDATGRRVADARTRSGAQRSFDYRLFIPAVG